MSRPLSQQEQEYLSSSRSSATTQYLNLDESAASGMSSFNQTGLMFMSQDQLQAIAEALSEFQSNEVCPEGVVCEYVAVLWCGFVMGERYRIGMQWECYGCSLRHSGLDLLWPVGCWEGLIAIERRVSVCVCVLAVWCSVCVLGSGHEVLSSSPTLAIFRLPPAPPVHPAVIGYLEFAGVQIQGLFS